MKFLYRFTSHYCCFLLFVSALLIQHAKAQITVQGVGNPNTLASNIAGPGVTVSGGKINCTGGAAGTFNATSTNLGISSGILLTTGTVQTAIGPNNNTADGLDLNMQGKPTFSDPQLIALESQAIYDVCILEFDIIPTCSTLTMNYVFASEEYPEFVCSGYNDVFGFFLSGQNPAGGAYNNQNIAIVPGTSLPVAINSINPGVAGSSGSPGGCASTAYSNLYVNNTPGTTIEYDGFTKPLTATASVVPCASYHMKIAIADAGDGGYDSGVFLTFQGLQCSTGPQPVWSKDTTICAGGVATLNASGALTYTWAPATGLSSTTGATVQASPAVTTTYTITFDNGPCGKTTKTVTVNVNGAVANAGSDAGICNGDNIQLNATGGGQYSWSPSNGLSATNIANPIASPTVTTTYVVTVSNGSCTDKDTLVITVGQPTAEAGNATSICNGQTTQLNATGAGPFLWSPAAGLSSATIANPIANPSTTTQYTVTVGSGNCVANDTVTVIVNPIPSASFTASAVCLPNSTNFTNTSTVAGGSIQTNVWNFGDNSPDNSQINPVHQYTNAGTFTVSLIVSANGCSDTISLPVTINQGSIVDFDATTVCLGQPTIFTDKSDNSGGIISQWNWTFGSSQATSTLQNPSHTFMSAGNHNVGLTIITVSGCTTSIEKPVVVSPLPIATFSYKDGCIGAPINFNNTSTVSNGNISSAYWNYGDSPSIDSALNGSHTFQTSGTFQVSLLVSSNSGCMDTSIQSIHIYAPPVPKFSISDSSGCAPLCVAFNNLSEDTSGATIAAVGWNFGDGTSANNSTQNHCYNNSGLYDITLTVTNDHQCTASLQVNDLIEVFPQPKADFIPTPDPVSVLEPSVYFTNTSVNGVYYHWDFGDGSTDSLKEPRHIFPEEVVTTYTVWLTTYNSFGCIDSVSKTVEVHPEYAIFIPNSFTPNNDGKNDVFAFTGIGITEARMWIYDRWGNQIAEITGLANGWDGKVQNGPSNQLVQIDTYVYIIRVIDVFGKSHQLVGNVNMLK